MKLEQDRENPGHVIVRFSYDEVSTIHLALAIARKEVEKGNHKMTESSYRNIVEVDNDLDNLLDLEELQHNPGTVVNFSG